MRLRYPKTQPKTKNLSQIHCVKCPERIKYPLTGMVHDRYKENEMVRKWISVIILVVVVASLSGCQTIQGVGEDIKWIGQQELFPSE